jgi:hypothetical protein
MKQEKLLLIQLNEVNFDVVQKYIACDQRRFNNLQALLKLKRIKTVSEDSYDELEPWIQWVSVHTGKDFNEHKIFRLGDIVEFLGQQIFEKLEQKGLRVGAILPMNAKNSLKKPAFFIPDPWTKTSSDGTFWSVYLGNAIAQAVNDNASSKISLKSLTILLAAFLRFASSSNYFKYAKLAMTTRKAPWRKALFLDLFLHDLHRKLITSKSPHFSTLFLNAGAHIQHHYFFNAAPIKGVFTAKNPDWYIKPDLDPIAEMLDIYNVIVGQILNNNQYEIIFATGLTQKPYDRLKFYYRLINLEDFLNKFKIRFLSAKPRMTRDFLIEFGDATEMNHAFTILSKIRAVKDGVLIFEELDRRKESLFVSLTYPNEIISGDLVSDGMSAIEFSKEVAFVAIKNGMHEGHGFAFFTRGVAQYAPENLSHVKELHHSVLSFFNN